jgi:hypothetical protein
MRTDVTIIRRDDARRATRLEPMTDAAWNWMRENASVVPGWWLFGGYDVSPEDGEILLAHMRAANLTMETGA